MYEIISSLQCHISQIAFFFEVMRNSCLSLKFDRKSNSLAKAFRLLPSAAHVLPTSVTPNVRSQTLGAHSVEMHWKNIYKGLIEQ